MELILLTVPDCPHAAVFEARMPPRSRTGWASPG
jgi:hypothetical protein